MTTEELVRLLNAKKTGKRRWIALCPAHPDKKASLRIAEGKKGILLKCGSQGCDTRDIVSNIGLRMRDLFYMERDQSSEQLKAIYRQMRIDALYEYELLRKNYLFIWMASKRPPLMKTTRDKLMTMVENMPVIPPDPEPVDRSWWPYLWPEKLAYKVGIKCLHPHP